MEVECNVLALGAVCGGSGRGGGVDCDVFDLGFGVCFTSDLGFTVVLGASGLGGGAESLAFAFGVGDFAVFE